MFKLCFYVPESHLEQVKTAVFAAADDRSYEVVRQYLQEFETTVRPVMLPTP